LLSLFNLILKNISIHTVLLYLVNGVKICLSIMDNYKNLLENLLIGDSLRS